MDSLSVIVPVYNEVRTLTELVEQVLLIDVVSEIIVVDDGSSDGSASAVRRCFDTPRVVLLEHQENLGKGAAVRTGIASAAGQFTLIQDADLEYNPTDIPALYRTMSESGVDAVYGSRYLEMWHVSDRILLDLGIGLLNRLTWKYYRIRLTDASTCYKMFRTADLHRMRLESERFELCQELTSKAARMGLCIKEVPISYHPRTISQGKKLRLKDGWTAVRALWNYRHWKPDPSNVRVPHLKSGRSELHV